MDDAKETIFTPKTDAVKAFDGLLPGRPISELDPSELSAFEKLKALLCINQTKYPDRITPEDY